MLHVSINIDSIHLNKQTISQIKTNNMIKLDISHKPLHFKQEYIINHLNGLNCINHEFKFTNTKKSMKEITLSIRKVEKKWCFGNLFKINFKKENSKYSNSIDPFTGKTNEKYDPNIQYEYEQLANSLLGYCKINIENLEEGVNNSIVADVINKRNSIIGHANIEI